MSSAAVTSCRHIYPSEYAYREYSVHTTERDSANCRNYPSGPEPFILRSEDYIHCDGTPLRLTDSDFESEQYTTSDYYVWQTDETRYHQLLFIFPTRVNLTTITLHYYHTSGRGLPRLKFWSVPDDFDIWNAPTSSYSYIDVAAVPPSRESAGQRNISIHCDNIVNTRKILLVKFSSSFPFALSEVEFFTCTGKSC